MSINLGSAHGEIVIKADGVARTASSVAKALREIESSSSGVAPALDKIGTAGQKIGAGVEAGTKRATDSIKELEAASKDAAAGFDKIGTAAGVGGAALAAGLGLAVKQASDLQAEVAAISTIAPEIDTSQVSRALSDMSTHVAQTQTQLASSLYNIFSSIDVSQGEALRLTEEFAKGAVAARTDAETFGTAILGVMNAYKLEVADAGHVSDVFFNTVNKGVISSEELASNLGNVSQSAKNAGVNFDTLGALIAAITKEGGQAATNVNNLNNVLQKIVTKEAQEGLNKLGITTKDANGNFRDIVAVLTDLDKVLGKMNQSQRAQVLQDLFPDMQARTGVQTLLSQLDMVKTGAEENAKASGVAAEAYRKMGETAQAQAVLLKNTLTAALTDLGNIALPNLTEAAQGIGALVKAFAGLPDPIKSLAVDGALAGAAILLLGSGAIKAVSTVKDLVTAVQAAAAALPLLTSRAAAAAVAMAPFIVSLVAVNGLAQAGTGQNLIQLGESIAKYGDLLGTGRDRAKEFVAANNELPALTKRIDELRASLAVLAQESAKYENFSLDAFYDLITGQSNRRTFQAGNIQKEIDLLEGYKHALEEKKAAEEAAANPVLGPPKPLFGPRIEEAQKYQRELAAVKAAQEGTLVPQGARPMAGAQQAEANHDVNLGTGVQEQLHAQATAAYEAQKALEAYQQEINAAAAANQQAQGAIQSQLGPMTAALDQLNQKRAAGLPLSQAEAALLQALPTSIGQATNAYSDLVIQGGRYQLLNQQLAAQTGQQTSAYSGISSEIDALVGRYNQLTGAIAQADSQMRALGSQNSKLASDYNILGARIEALQEKAKTKIGLSGDEQTELHNLLAVQKEIGDEMGDNAAKQRELVLQQRTWTKEGQQTALAIKAAADAAELAAKSRPFAFKEDRREGGPDLPPSFFAPRQPVNVKVQADPASLAAIPGQIAGLDVPPILVKVLADLKTAGADVGARAAAAFGGQQQTVNVGVNDQASAALNNVQSALQAIGSTKATATVGVADNATGPLDTIKGKIDAYAKTTADPALGAQDNASATIAGVQKNLNDYGASSAQPPVGVTDNASGPLGDILTLLNDIAGRSINITANVDTSGALAAIADLRAHMPSSPAKKGPFHKLPNWQSVYQSLEPAGDEAVRTINRTVTELSGALAVGMDGASKESAELATAIAGAVKASVEALTELRTFRPPAQSRADALRDALRTIVEGFAADAAGTPEEARKAAADWAEGVGKVMGAVGSGVDALGKLREFRRPADTAIRDFRDSAQLLIATMLDVARGTDAELVAAGAKWAESAGAVYASVGSGVDALTKLQTFRRPVDKAVTDFRDVSQFLVNVIQQVAADGDLGAAADAARWAESAGAIFASVGSGVDALTKLQAFARPTDQAVKSFRDVAQFLVNVIAQVAADGEREATANAAKYAEDAGKIVAFLSSGIDALAKLGDFTRPDDQAVQSFRDVAQFLVNLVAQVAADGEAGAVAAAARYAEDAGKIAQFLGAGADALAKLRDFARPSDDAIQAFADAAEHATYLIGRSAAAFDATTLADAAKYADTAGKVVGLIGSGADALTKLAHNEFAAPSNDQLRAFADATLRATRAIADAAGAISGKALADAARYADDAGKVVALLGAGVEGFNGLATFVAPSAEQINRWKSAVSATVIAIAQASKEVDRDAVKAAGEYADGAGKAVGLLGASLSAFKGLDKEWVAPSKEAIDSLVAVTRYGVDQLIGIAGLYGKGQLSALADFADSATKGYGALKAAADAAKALDDKDRKRPVDAINTLLSEFQEGLGPLAALVEVSRTYLSQSAAFAQNISQAYANLGGALPGFDPQRATASAEVAVSGQQTTIIIHRHEPQDVNLHFLGENGQWIVKSLTVDGTARTQTAGIIAGEIGAALAQTAPLAS